MCCTRIKSPPPEKKGLDGLVCFYTYWRVLLIIQEKQELSRNRHSYYLKMTIGILDPLHTLAPNLVASDIEPETFKPRAYRPNDQATHGRVHYEKFSIVQIVKKVQSLVGGGKSIKIDKYRLFKKQKCKFFEAKLKFRQNYMDIFQTFNNFSKLI